MRKAKAFTTVRSETLSMLPRMPLITCLLYTLRIVLARFDPMAAKNPTQAKEMSVAEAMDTPTTIGIMEATRDLDGRVPRTMAAAAVTKRGSVACGRRRGGGVGRGWRE